MFTYLIKKSKLNYKNAPAVVTLSRQIMALFIGKLHLPEVYRNVKKQSIRLNNYITLINLRRFYQDIIHYILKFFILVQ